MLYNVLYTVVVKELNIILVCTFIKPCWKVVTHFTFIHTLQYRNQKFKNSHETRGRDRKLDLHWQWMPHDVSTDTKPRRSSVFWALIWFWLTFRSSAGKVHTVNQSVPPPTCWDFQQRQFQLKHALCEKRHRLRYLPYTCDPKGTNAVNVPPDPQRYHSSFNVWFYTLLMHLKVTARVIFKGARSSLGPCLVLFFFSDSVISRFHLAAAHSRGRTVYTTPAGLEEHAFCSDIHIFSFADLIWRQCIYNWSTWLCWIPECKQSQN